ncbi:hypothetical protein IPJ72_03265 [Candidatus Peregrinibacteria bacterium]|nr:MAG: hypothetical protein IPJ72_03265 [Candidatus Peregrinibacteria bacterium]
MIQLSFGQINAATSNLSPFYIDPELQFNQNPPLGFSRGQFFESTQTIR